MSGLTEQAPTASNDDEMPAEIDFSKGVRGKFAMPDVKLVLPVSVDEEAPADPASTAPGGNRPGPERLTLTRR